MKTKKYFSFFLFAILIASTSCVNNDTFIYGYIPVGEKLKINWGETNNNNYFLIKTIIVVTSRGDTVSAILDNGIFNQSCIEYRDTYPPTKDKNVYVQLRKQEDGKFYMVTAIR